MACAGRFGFRFERFWGIWLSKRLFFDVWTHFSPDLCRRNWRIDQIPHSDEVVSSGRKGEYPSDLVHAAMSGLTQHSDCLQPAEYFLDPFPLNLTYFVSGVSRGAPINGAAAATFVVLRHMRRDVHASYLAYELFGVVALVGSHRYALALDSVRHQHRRIAFRGAIGLQQLRIHHQAVAVLNQHIAAVGQLRLVAAALARQPRISICRRFVRFVAAPLAMKVHRGIARIIRRRPLALVLALNTLLARPRFNQSAVHTEVLIAQQIRRSRLRHYAGEEQTGDLAFQ